MTEIHENEIATVGHHWLHAAFFQCLHDLITLSVEFRGDRIEITFGRIQTFRFVFKTTSDHFLGQGWTRVNTILRKQTGRHSIAFENDNPYLMNDLTRTNELLRSNRPSELQARRREGLSCTADGQRSFPHVR